MIIDNCGSPLLGKTTFRLLRRSQVVDNSTLDDSIKSTKLNSDITLAANSVLREMSGSSHHNMEPNTRTSSASKPFTSRGSHDNSISATATFSSENSEPTMKGTLSTHASPTSPAIGTTLLSNSGKTKSSGKSSGKSSDTKNNKVKTDSGSIKTKTETGNSKTKIPASTVLHPHHSDTTTHKSKIYVTISKTSTPTKRLTTNSHEPHSSLYTKHHSHGHSHSHSRSHSHSHSHGHSHNNHKKLTTVSTTAHSKAAATSTARLRPVTVTSDGITTTATRDTQKSNNVLTTIKTKKKHQKEQSSTVVTKITHHSAVTSTKKTKTIRLETTKGHVKTETAYIDVTSTYTPTIAPTRTVSNHHQATASAANKDSTSPPTTSTLVGSIVGSVAGLALIVVFLFVILSHYRKRKRPLFGSMERIAATDDDEDEDYEDDVSYVRSRSTFPNSVLSLFGLARKKKPVAVSNVPDDQGLFAPQPTHSSSQPERSFYREPPRRDHQPVAFLPQNFDFEKSSVSSSNNDESFYDVPFSDDSESYYSNPFGSFRNGLSARCETVMEEDQHGQPHSSIDVRSRFTETGSL